MPTKKRKAKQPGVGLGVLVVRDKKILLSKRLKPYGYRKKALPGGRVEWMETLEECARREVLEETGIRLGKIHSLYTYSEEVHPKLKQHYVTFYMIARCPDDQEPIQGLEPTKHGEWGWYDPFNLPRDTWEPTKRLCGLELNGGSATLLRAFINEKGITFD